MRRRHELYGRLAVLPLALVDPDPRLRLQQLGPRGNERASALATGIPSAPPGPAATTVVSSTCAATVADARPSTAKPADTNVAAAAAASPAAWRLPALAPCATTVRKPASTTAAVLVMIVRVACAGLATLAISTSFTGVAAIPFASISSLLILAANPARAAASVAAVPPATARDNQWMLVLRVSVYKRPAATAAVLRPAAIF